MTELEGEGQESAASLLAFRSRTGPEVEANLTAKRNAARTEETSLTAARDAALADVSRVTPDRDVAHADATCLTTERDAARSEFATSAHALTDETRLAALYEAFSSSVRSLVDSVQSLESSRGTKRDRDE